MTIFNETTDLGARVSLEKSFQENASIEILAATTTQESIIGFLFVATIVFGMGILMGMMVSTLITLKEPLNQSSDEIPGQARMGRRNAIISLEPFEIVHQEKASNESLKT